MARKEIKVFYSPGCGPCHETVDRLKAGRFESDLGEDAAVNLIDISTEEGFKEIEKEGLERIPTARYQGKTCQIRIDEELDAVILLCEEPKEGTPTAEAPNTDNPTPPAEPIQP
jgi:hypothetical protein